MSSDEQKNNLFFLRKGNVYFLPALHYNMETAALARQAFLEIQPDCVAVELAETMQLQLMHAASRLPDVSVVVSHGKQSQPIYYLSEPCDAAFEGLRSALDSRLPCFCVDLDIDNYQDSRELMPDPYAIFKIGLKSYYELYHQSIQGIAASEQDLARELHMAKRLKELSFSHERVLFIGGMAHIPRIMEFLDRSTFPIQKHVERNQTEVCALTESSCRDVMAECGWISMLYEESRSLSFPWELDRQKEIYQLYKKASLFYSEETGNAFPGYHLRNIMKFARNYSIITNRLVPDLYQILSAAKGCVDHNYAYEVWLLATSYIYQRNVDNLPELDLSVEDIWGRSKSIRFHLKQPGRKNNFMERRKKDKTQHLFRPGPFTICSYPPEDLVIERFGGFLKKKGTQLLSEESSRTVPFSSSLEDGIDTKESIRHWHEKKLYVKTKGKPPGGVGSVVVIFDNEQPDDDKSKPEKHPWKTTWIGEHNQESDMAFYATNIGDNVIGPGISRCEYGGFMMSYPPRRVFDVWSDPDYEECRTKAEVLLMSAIDYAAKPLIVYVASSPPRSWIKSFARRYGKKVVYIPIGQLSPVTLNKLRVFHVLDGRDRRDIADEYIY